MSEKSMECIVHLESVRKVFRDTIAVRDVCLNIVGGARVGVVGENGAGKSSLFNLILGTARPTSGDVRVFGLNPHLHAEAVRERIGFVSAHHPFYKWMKIRELLQFVRPFYPRWNRDFEKELLESLSISLKKHVGELSTGMLARVALLLSLAHEPDLLIFDEPFTGLDAVSRDEIQRSIKRYLDRKRDRSILLATHHPEEIRRLVDSILILSDGNLVYDKPITNIGESIKRVHLECSPEASLDQVAMIRSQRTSHGWILIVHNWHEGMTSRIEQVSGGRVTDICPVDLEDCLLIRSEDDE